MYLTEPEREAAPPAGEVPPEEPALPRSRVSRMRWVGLALSAAVLAASFSELRHVDLRQVAALWPAGPAFWLLFLVYYATPVACEWAIFRRLWSIPAEGAVALARKYVGNELLLGYIGEAYFYTWARQRAALIGAPFGAIKDVAILSAMVGNAATVAIMAAAFPFIGGLQLGPGGRLSYISMFVVILTSLAVLVLRRRLFSLSVPELRFIAALHVLRIAAMTLLAAWMWHLVLPAVAVGWWLLLSALRLMLSRLPLIPNKDLVFAGLAVVAVGHHVEVTAMLAMIASLLLATHVFVGLAATGAELLPIGGPFRRRGPQAKRLAAKANEA